MKVLSVLAVLTTFPIMLILFGLAVSYWGVPTVLMVVGFPFAITTIAIGFNAHITVAKYIHSRWSARRYKKDAASLKKSREVYPNTPRPLLPDPMQEIGEDIEEVILKVNDDGSEALVNSTTGEVLDFLPNDEDPTEKLDSIPWVQKDGYRINDPQPQAEDDAIPPIAVVYVR